MALRPYPLRITDEVRERWKREADRRGCSLADLIRDAVEAEVGGTPEPVARGRKGGKAAATPTRAGGRTVPCVHHRGADEYCSRCDG